MGPRGPWEGSDTSSFGIDAAGQPELGDAKKRLAGVKGGTQGIRKGDKQCQIK